MKPKSLSPQQFRYAPCATRFRPECLQLEARVLPAVNILGGFAGFNSDSMVSPPDLEPPEPQVAAGPNRLIQTANFNIAFYDGNGVLLNNQSLPAFWASLKPGQDTLIDPSICYDELAKRFVVVILEVDFNLQNSFIDLAVSTTDSPTSSADFTILQFNNTVVGVSPDTDRYFGDFPRLGYNADVYVVSSNTKSIPQTLSGESGPDKTLGPEVVVFDKNNLANPHPPGLGQVAPGGNANWQTVPARMHGAKPGDPMWLVEETAFGNGILLNKQNQVNEVSVLRLTNLFAPTLTLTNYPLPVEPYTYPSGVRTFTAYAANQPGGILVPALGADMQSVAYRNGVLAAADQVGNANDSPLPHVRWYLFDTTGPTPVLTQQGTLNPGAGVSTLFPSVELDANGDLGMTYMQSSPTEYMSMYVTGRTPVDPPNTLQPGVRVQAGTGMWFPNAVDSIRAGDYSGISVDPNNPSAFWGSNEYARAVDSSAANSFSTFISHFSLSPGVTGNSIVTGAGAGGGPEVKVFDPQTSAVLADFFAFDPGFTGGVRVALGDVNGDSTPDVIVGAGPGGGPNVLIIDGTKLALVQPTGQIAASALLANFFAFDPAFVGGVFVASGNFSSATGAANVVVGAGAGGGPAVRVFQIVSGTAAPLAGPLGNFFAYDPAFAGGVTVAAGNFEGTGDEVITGAGAGGGPNVRVFRPNGTVAANFMAYDPSFGGGVFVAAGDLDADSKAEVIAGPGPGMSPTVRIFHGGDAALITSFLAYDPMLTGGVRPGVVMVTGKPAIVTGPGPGSGAQVRTFNSITTALLDSFFAYNPLFLGGVFVAGR